MNMKKIILAMAIVSLCISGTVFAESNPANDVSQELKEVRSRIDALEKRYL